MTNPKLFFTFYFRRHYTNAVKSIQPINILFSAGHHYKKDGFFLPKLMPHKELFLDSGGFQLIGKFGDYPFSNKEYLNYVEVIKPDFVASLDYPCDGLDKNKKLTNDERILKTVENARWLVENCKSTQVVPVIQGYKLSEYKKCINLLKENDLVSDYLGVGSICIRKDERDVYQILKLCKKETKTNLHAFGLSLNFVKNKKIRNLVSSFDTFAWMYAGSKYGRILTFTGKRLVKLHTRGPNNSEYQRLKPDEMVFLTLKAYKEYYDFLCQKWNKNQNHKLTAWC